MKIPKVSLILLAPGQDMYCYYLNIKEMPTLKGYPYVIILHGSQDETVSLEDSIRLIDSSSYVQCKLEVVEDNHSLKTLSSSDYREFIEEAFTKGRERLTSLNLQKNHPNTPLRKEEEEVLRDCDSALFFLDENEKENDVDRRSSDSNDITESTSSVNGYSHTSSDYYFHPYTQKV